MKFWQLSSRRLNLVSPSTNLNEYSTYIEGNVSHSGYHTQTYIESLHPCSKPSKETNRWIFLQDGARGDTKGLLYVFCKWTSEGSIQHSELPSVFFLFCEWLFSHNHKRIINSFLNNGVFLYIIRISISDSTPVSSSFQLLKLVKLYISYSLRACQIRSKGELS